MKKEQKDNLYGQPLNSVEDFKFDKETAVVFDDMVDRSVPFYAEIQRMICELAAEYAVEGTNVYDLGCSTCTTFIALDKILPNNISFVGLDSSSEMLDKGREKIVSANVTRKIELQTCDLNKKFVIKNASVVVMNLTLQFIRPLYRQTLIKMIAEGMNKNSCLLLVEKVLSPDSSTNRLFIKLYYEFKRRNGYSDLEISQKREALENILVPYKLAENQELLLNHGFSSCETFFRWYNFCGMIAVK